MSEIEKVRERYDRRLEKGLSHQFEQYFDFIHFSRSEREYWATVFLRKHLAGSLETKRILEIGAGHGDNIHFMMRAGFRWENIFVNELLEERVNSLKQWVPNDRIFSGDVLSIPKEQTFDIIFQSVVFSSILDQRVQKQIANHCIALLNPGGLFLWYDFCFDNPKNRDVKGVSKKEVLSLFSGSMELVQRRKVTLAPPLGRRVGRAYGLVNSLFPFLRTHELSLFRKGEQQ